MQISPAHQNMAEAERERDLSLILQDFQISPETGFLPRTPPLRRLPGEYFAPWEELIASLPELNKTRQLRAAVNDLPERDFTGATLSSEEEWRRAYVLLCFIGQSYIWGEGQAGLVDTVPKKIAIPWCHVSDHLHTKPVVSYATTVLYNFYLRDPQGPWDADNFEISNTFTGSEDESWFYLVPLLIELAVAPALEVIGKVFADMAQNRIRNVLNCLKTVQQSIQGMRKALARMYERCRPVAFYTEIRPFQAGTKGLDVLPEGIYFEGVDPIPRRYNGASAGQSAAIHVFDIFLGVKHSGDEEDFLVAMRTHMPRKHEEFLHRLAGMPSIRAYCKDSGEVSLVQAYNAAVEEFVKFRCDHVILVTRYIVNQLEHSINPALDAKGSGGTDFMQFLKKVRNATKELLILQSS